MPVTRPRRVESTKSTVRAAGGEAPERMSLRELAARNDSSEFTPVHRSLPVNTRHILSATRDALGHYSLGVRGLSRPMKLSRALAHLFRPTSTVPAQAALR
jgi:DNA-binding LytR/AlgR family response regulator